MRFLRSSPILPGFFLVALTALAACAGGSTNPPQLNTGSLTTPPPTVPTLAPATATTSVPLASAATPQPVTIPPAAGLSGTVTLPAATIPPGTSLDIETTTVAPSGVAALNVGRFVQAARTVASGSGLEVLYYQGVRFSQTVTFPAYPAFSIALPSGYDATLGSYGLAFYDGSGWHYPLGSPGVAASSSQITFASASGPVTYQANQFYFFALYYAPAPPSPTPSPTPTATPSPSPQPTATPTATAQPTATPTATPTSTPTATPTPTPVPTAGPLSASPSSLQFLGTGTDLAQTLTISSSFYSGGFTTDPNCTDSGGNVIATVATAATASGARKTTLAVPDNNGRFSVTPVAAGQCTITVTDAGGRTIAVPVSVATSTLTVQSRKH